MAFIDLGELLTIFTQDMHPLRSSWILLKNGGWIPVIYALYIGLKDVWLEWRQTLFGTKRKWILLAIDVPRDIEQSPKAAENIFSALMGALSGINLLEKWYQGKTTDQFSFEIVSHEGYTQFYVYVNRPMRDLIEAAIYSQYPDAEIMEVEDYVKPFPDSFPDDQYDLWGAELVPFNNTIYPIRTYVEFEHQLTQTFKDPMASLLEAMSRCVPGEQIWYQIVVTPVDQTWKTTAQAFIDKKIGKKVDTKKGTLESFAEGFEEVMMSIPQELLGLQPTVPEKPPQQYPSLMQFLSPADKNEIEAIALKMGKIGFLTKIRFIYIGRKEVFSKARGVATFLGAMNQFAGNHNGLKPDKQTKTAAYYYFTKYRLARKQTKLITYYKGRSNWSGAPRYILNSEELATLWHFPIIDVKSPAVTKAGARRSEPPGNIPTIRDSYISEDEVSTNTSPHGLPMIE